MKSSQIGNLLGMAGVLYGIYNAIDKNQGFAKASVYTIFFGVVGVVIGNTIDKLNDK